MKRTGEKVRGGTCRDRETSFICLVRNNTFLKGQKVVLFYFMLLYQVFCVVLVAMVVNQFN